MSWIESCHPVAVDGKNEVPAASECDDYPLLSRRRVAETSKTESWHLNNVYLGLINPADVTKFNLNCSCIQTCIFSPLCCVSHFHIQHLNVTVSNDVYSEICRVTD